MFYKYVFGTLNKNSNIIISELALRKMSNLQTPLTFKSDDAIPRAIPIKIQN